MQLNSSNPANQFALYQQAKLMNRDSANGTPGGLDGSSIQTKFGGFQT